MFKRFSIGEQERGFLFRHGRYRGYLRPGIHWRFGFGWSVRQCFATGSLYAKPGLIEAYARDAETWDDLAYVELKPHERALVWVDGQLRRVVSVRAAAYFKVGQEVRIEVRNAREVVLPREVASLALEAEGARSELEAALVPEGAVGIIIKDEAFVGELAPGPSLVWKSPGSSQRIEVVPRGRQSLEVSVVGAWTRDLATVDLDVSFDFRISSPRRWALDPEQSIVRLHEAALAATRDAVGRSMLERVVADRPTIALALESALANREGGASVIDILAATIGKVSIVRRLPRRRFRGFGDQGREVATALRELAAKPYFFALHGARRR